MDDVLDNVPAMGQRMKLPPLSFVMILSMGRDNKATALYGKKEFYKRANEATQVSLKSFNSRGAWVAH